MTGRDPNEAHRVATPLELLFDLTFASCFSLAASQYARVLAEGRYGAALVGFGFATFAICWAWSNFSWFSSAYDTDDWIFRLVTMVQMVGVLVLATGLPRMFGSLEHGDRLDNSTMVLGYVIMRVALVAQWLRAARQDPARRRTCLTYASVIFIAQVGWVLLVVLQPSAALAIVLGSVLAVIELSTPFVVERAKSAIPWHAHHIVERHSLFAIIALGEGVVGTVAALAAIAQTRGWTFETVLIAVAGTALTFSMWWIYYLIPSAEVLHRHPRRALVWGMVQLLIVTSIAATGAGLHFTAYVIEGQALGGASGAAVSVAAPVAVFLGTVYGLSRYLRS